MDLSIISKNIPEIDRVAIHAARMRQSRLTKPLGSLGRIEDISIQLAGITGKKLPQINKVSIFVFAADHGVAQRKVSAYPVEVTEQMVLNFVAGGAVINTLSKLIEAHLVVTDVGVACDFPEYLPILHKKIRKGTRDWVVEPAMTASEFHQALEAGYSTMVYSGVTDLVVVGEMGIGNTATAAAMASAMLNIPPLDLVGRGTGLDDEGVLRKCRIVEEGLQRVGKILKPDQAAIELGGYEIVAMAGVIIAAAERRIPVLLDGFISTTAGLLASKLIPAVQEYLIASHRSPEKGHAVILDALKLTPLLDLGMRLGEASGAAMAVPLMKASVSILANVATFAEAGVSQID